MGSVRRVALLSLHSSPLGQLGGPDVGGMNLYVRQLADGLAECGVAVDVYTRRSDRATPEILEMGSGARLIHVSAGPARRLPKSVLPLHLPSMVSAMRIFTQQQGLTYDVLHSHYWLSGLAAMRYRACCAPDVPLVHMFHTLARVKDFYLGELDRNDSALRADGERCVITRADVVVGSTTSEFEEMTRLYGRAPHHTAIIPPGVDFDTFRPRGKSESRLLLGLEDRRIILFVGRQDPLKGLDVLLRSVACLPEALRDGLKVVLVGGHESRGAEAARRTKLIRRLGLEAIVEVRGKASQDQLPLYYSAADVCAVPSAYESFGMAALESMACQTPVVAFAVGGLATTIRDGQTGFLARPGNVEEYGSQLAHALTSDRLNAIGRRARMSVQPYTWDAVAESTLQLYASMTSDVTTGVPASAV